MKFLIREIMSYIFQTIGIAGLKTVASHVDRSPTLSFLN